MRPTRTLLVDDEPLARERLRNFLAREPGVELAGECAHGAEAVERIRAVRPDLVFLDVQMPGMNGFEVLEQLGDDLPPAVVFVTALNSFESRANSSVSGGNEFIGKPFLFIELGVKALVQIWRTRITLAKAA